MNRISLIFDNIVPVRADRLLFGVRRSSSRAAEAGLDPVWPRSPEPYPATNSERRAHFRRSLTRTLVASFLAGMALIAMVAVVVVATS